MTYIEFIEYNKNKIHLYVDIYIPFNLNIYAITHTHTHTLISCLNFKNRIHIVFNKVHQNLKIGFVLMPPYHKGKYFTQSYYFAITFFSLVKQCGVLPLSILT